MSKATIMIVEDSKFIQDLLSNMLSQNQRIERVIICDDAETAHSAIVETNPDLILMNIVLPGMGGIELCRQLHRSPKTTSIPVIFLTSSNTEEDLSNCYAAGGVDFILKPFRAVEINSRINIHLEIKRFRDELEAANEALRSANRDLLNMAQTDALTKLANRRRASEVLESELMRSTRYQIPLSVAMIDIDHFKRVNDTYGHAGGDLVLQKLSELLERISRRSDIPARWGGEEFIVILTHTNHLQAMIFAERVQKALQELVIEYEGQSIKITLTIGIAQAFPECNTAVLTSLADRALYHGKENGRNQAVDAHALEGAPQPFPPATLPQVHS